MRQGSNVKSYIGEPHGALPATPSTGAYESALDKAAAGMNEITKGLQMVGKIGEDLYAKHKKDKRENDLQAMQLESEKKFLEFKTGYDRSNPDPSNYAKGIEKAWDEIVKGQSNATKDTETRRVFQDRMNGRKLTEMPRAFVEQEQRFQNQYFAQSMKNVDECKNMAIETDDPDRAEMFKQMMIEELEKGYPFTAEFARAHAEKNLEEIKTKRAGNALNRVSLDILRDPSGTMQKLMLPPESGSYSEITDPLIREKLKKGAEEIFQHKQTEQRTEEARIKKENLDAEEFRIEGLYATGKLKIDDIWETKFIDKAKWTDRIRARQDREKLGVPIKTNFSTYAKIQDMIFTGQPKATVRKAIVTASEIDLSEQDCENLLNKSTAYEGSVNDQYLHRSYSYIRDRFMKPDLTNPGAFIEKFMGGNEKYYRNLNALDLEIQKARQKGKPLEGQAIFDKAKEITGEPSVNDYIKRPPEIKPSGKKPEKKFKTIDAYENSKEKK